MALNSLAGSALLFSFPFLVSFSKCTNQGCWKTTNHSRASCFIRSRMTSRPHRLKKTWSMQSKRRDLHHTWLYREPNEKLSFYCYSPRWITTTLPMNNSFSWVSYSVYKGILRVYALVLSKAIFEMHKASIVLGKTFDMKTISFIISNVYVTIILTLIS